MSTMTVVSVIGTGTMGAPIARNLAKAGFQVQVWNRTAGRAQALEGGRIHAAERVGDAIDGADAVVTMLSDGAAVEAAVWEALEDFGGAVWVQMSTVGVVAGEKLAASADAHGVRFVDAPVLGTRQPAEQGELTVLASGPGDLRDRCDPLFSAIGSRTFWLGPAGAGTRMKLVTNAWLVGLVAALAESVVLAEALTVEPSMFLEIIDGSPIGAPYAQVKGRSMVERDFTPSFALKLARKDVGLVLEAAERAGIDPNIARAVARQFDNAIEMGHGDEDLAAALFGAGGR
jgi:3-hydroxyisobutyrate dehydrogenase